jgi:molybdopterin converting factor subunit 1
MKIQIVAFGIARDILQGSEIQVDLEGTPTIADLKNSLLTNYPEFNKLTSLRFAVNEEYQSDTYALQSNDEVVIIPPVSGG